MIPIGIGRPLFVDADEALAYHDISITRFGGSTGVRDHGLLESALAQARASFAGKLAHEFPFEMAAAYAFHIAKNHPFVDGNKRTALMCCGAFLHKNGWALNSQGVEAADAIIKLVEGALDKKSFSTWLEVHCVPRPSMELRDFFHRIQRAGYIGHLSSLIAQSNDESMATIIEAGRAMPIVADFLEQLDHAKATGDANTANSALLNAVALSTLFRLAEDMGYEW